MTTRTRIMCIVFGLTLLPIWSSSTSYARTRDAIPATQSSNSVADWSRIVYTSLVEADAGIYVANGDGSAPRQIPGTSSADTTPRLNRGASTIVFVSRRDGNDEIYRMNVEGGDVRRLTDDSASDTTPTWSHDGRQIIWTRKGFNDSDLYMMNADGSGLRRLTDAPADDTEPAVSPDGTRIAWVRRVPDGAAGWQGTLWTMNSDGGDARALGDTQPQLAHPTWHPDGASISFAVGGSMAGIYSYALNAGYASQRVALGHHLEPAVLHNGGWSPDGNFLFYTYQYFRAEYGGEGEFIGYVFDRSEVKQQKVLSNVSTRLTSGMKDIAPDWQSLDTYSPSSRMTPLPAYSSEEEIEVRWSGVDAGGAGVASYDLQYRTATTEWQDWLKATTATSARYDQEAGVYLPLGEPVYFRVRARDHAYNTEAWPDAEMGDTSTTISIGSIAGTITDNRGLPIPNASIVATQPFIDPVRTDATGHYSAYIARYDWVSDVYARHPGYASSPKELRYPQAEDDYSAYLAPLDDRVVNGTFEGDGAQIQGWRTSGSSSVRATQDQRYTGSKGALLGQACAFPCLSEPSLFAEGSSFPAMVPGNDGIIHAIWQRATSWDPRIEATLYYSQRALDGTWSTPQAFAMLTSYYETLNAQLAIDGNGALHAVWGAVEGTYYAKRTPAGQWQPQELIGLVRNARIAADRRGGVHITYTTPQSESFYLRRPSDGTWANPIKLGAGDNSTIPSVATSPNNDVHVAWMEANPYPEFDADVLVRTFRADGTRLPIQNLGVGTSPLLVVDGQGVPYVVYSNGFRSQASDGSWSSWSQLIFTDSWTDRNVNTKYAWGDPQGGFYAQELLSPDPNASQNHYLLHWDADTKQTRSSVLAGFAPFVVDTNNRLHMLEPSFDGLQYRGTRDAERTGTASLEQQIVIPANMHRPTLAFMYRLKNTEQTSKFSVLLSDNLGTTAVFSSTDDTLWTQASLDVSSWLGKTVTVVFKLDQAADRAFAELALDDVTLGSWNTPVISTISPQQLDAKATSTLTITGDNFIGTPQVMIGTMAVSLVERIDEHTLNIAVPSQLAPGLYDVVVTNPGRQQAVLPRTLRVGLATHIPLIVR